MIHTIIVVLTCFIVSSANADESPVIDFSVQPRLCVLSAKETICKDDVEIQWKSEAHYSLCLYSDEEPQPLHCWKEAWEGSHELFVETSTAIDFYLKNADTQQVLASQIFEVIQDVQRYRRRRRNPWSFF